MKSYIITGTPGAGKTAILQSLRALGYACVDEAATDIIKKSQGQGIAAPWLTKDFIDQIVSLQKQRQQEALLKGLKFCFYDRSPVCTLALAKYLNYKPSKILLNELQRMKDEQVYEQKVFFLENLGFIENTDARRISFEEAIRFEQFHRQAYEEWGYELIYLPKGPIEERVERVLSALFSMR